MAQFTAGEVLTAANLNNAINGPTINAQGTATSYTLAATDTGKLVTFDGTATATLTVPTEASVAFTAGAAVAVAQLGAGTVTLAASSGVTINTSGSSIAQYGAMQLYYLDSDEWLVVGNVS